MAKCFSCKKELDIGGKPARGDTCPICTADLRCCYNCGFYDKASYNECREPQAERVVEKGRSNFCDYFVFTGSGDTSGEDDATDPLSALKGLFGDD